MTTPSPASGKSVFCRYFYAGDAAASIDHGRMTIDHVVISDRGADVQVSAD
jgi:hypothetical protein